MSEGARDAVDLVFPVAGPALPEDYPFALLRGVASHLPWFESDPDAGIHPIRGASTSNGVVLLARRAKLVLRLRRHRVADALSLAGRTLDVAGTTLAVGGGTLRPLRPWSALYARLVATECEEEAAFLAGVAARLAALAARATPVCGRRGSLRAAGRKIEGFSLMLHELAAEHSLLLQQVGLGGERKLGCGIFVPHRLAAAVGGG